MCSVFGSPLCSILFSTSLFLYVIFVLCFSDLKNKKQKQPRSEEMENKSQVGSSPSSSSSFTADLFGSKESNQPPPSAGRFASIFPSPSQVAGANSSCLEDPKYVQKRFSEIMPKSSEGICNGVSNKEKNTIFQERLVPCPLSSSIYYGGLEDMYMHSSGTQIAGSYSFLNKDPVEDDFNINSSNCAHRGNWWQGSLYY